MKLFSFVALLEDMPSLMLCRGQVGLVTEKIGDKYLVEFRDRRGITYAKAELKAEEVMPLILREVDARPDRIN